MRDVENEIKATVQKEKDTYNQARTTVSTIGQVANALAQDRSPSTEEMRIRAKLNERRHKLYRELADLDNALSDLNDESVRKLLRVISVSQS